MYNKFSNIWNEKKGMLYLKTYLIFQRPMQEHYTFLKTKNIGYSIF